jgi:hypothetical protein
LSTVRASKEDLETNGVFIVDLLMLMVCSSTNSRFARAVYRGSVEMVHVRCVTLNQTIYCLRPEARKIYDVLRLGIYMDEPSHKQGGASLQKTQKESLGNNSHPNAPHCESQNNARSQEL